MKPKCRLCGHTHWLHEAHVFVNNPVNAVNKPVNTNVNKECADCKEKEAVIARLKQELERLTGPKVSRQEYMREYMKKRRQKI